MNRARLRPDDDKNHSDDKNKPPPVMYRELFTYAARNEKIMMLVAFLSATGHGSLRQAHAPPMLLFMVVRHRRNRSHRHRILPPTLVPVLAAFRSSLPTTARAGRCCSQRQKLRLHEQTQTAPQ